MLSYGFMGDVMAESENYRWLGPLRYDMVRLRELVRMEVLALSCTIAVLARRTAYCHCNLSCAGGKQ